MKKLFSIVNSFFFRIFLWFWVATILLITASLWLASQYMSTTQTSISSKEDTNRLLQLAASVELQLLTSQQQNITISDAISQIAVNKRLPMLLVKQNTKTLFYAIPPPARLVANEVLPFINLPYLSSIQTANVVFLGPAKIQIKNEEYALFFAQPHPLNWLLGASGDKPTYILIVTIIGSGILCFLLAWTIVKPIRALRKASQQMALGDLSTQIDVESIGRDELGALSKDFNTMATKIQQHVKLQQQLLADISHELKSPLARQHIAHDLLKVAIKDGNIAEAETLAERANTETNRLDYMISQLLQLSDWNSANKSAFSVISLPDIIEDILEDAQFEAANMNKRIAANITQNINIFGNIEKLDSAFENVIRNAIKYAAQNIEITLTVVNNQAVLEVFDDGSGVDEPDINHIFEPFYRASRARERDTGGVGIGLAITHKVISDHRGCVYAKNQVPNGLHVCIKLPITT